MVSERPARSRKSVLGALNSEIEHVDKSLINAFAVQGKFARARRPSLVVWELESIHLEQI